MKWVSCSTITLPITSATSASVTSFSGPLSKLFFLSTFSILYYMRTLLLFLLYELFNYLDEKVKVYEDTLKYYKISLFIYFELLISTTNAIIAIF